jgi:hypothetical protein
MQSTSTTCVAPLCPHAAALTPVTSTERLHGPERRVERQRQLLLGRPAHHHGAQRPDGLQRRARRLDLVRAVALGGQ